MANTKDKSKGSASKASKEMRDPNATKEQKSQAARELNSRRKSK
jgi:hypothetical protein